MDNRDLSTLTIMSNMLSSLKDNILVTYEDKTSSVVSEIAWDEFKIEEKIQKANDLINKCNQILIKWDVKTSILPHSVILDISNLLIEINLSGKDLSFILDHADDVNNINKNFQKFAFENGNNNLDCLIPKMEKYFSYKKELYFKISELERAESRYFYLKNEVIRVKNVLDDEKIQLLTPFPILESDINHGVDKYIKKYKLMKTSSKWVLKSEFPDFSLYRTNECLRIHDDNETILTKIRISLDGLKKRITNIDKFIEHHERVIISKFNNYTNTSYFFYEKKYMQIISNYEKHLDTFKNIVSKFEKSVEYFLMECQYIPIRTKRLNMFLNTFQSDLLLVKRDLNNFESYINGFKKCGKPFNKSINAQKDLEDWDNIILKKAKELEGCVLKVNNSTKELSIFKKNGLLIETCIKELTQLEIKVRNFIDKLNQMRLHYNSDEHLVKDIDLHKDYIQKKCIKYQELINKNFIDCEDIFIHKMIAEYQLEIKLGEEFCEQVENFITKANPDHQIMVQLNFMEDLEDKVFKSHNNNEETIASKNVFLNLEDNNRHESLFINVLENESHNCSQQIDLDDKFI